MRKIVAMAVICLTAASGLTSAYAAQLADDEAGLRIRLKNELRRADKPSAGAGRDIYAWVQGGLLDLTVVIIPILLALKAERIMFIN
ncbi:hypothetical protein VEE46_20880 [Escherichia coli]|nr:hypothetical protein VEE46_20880 [Escherichia coli]